MLSHSLDYSTLIACTLEPQPVLTMCIHGKESHALQSLFFPDLWNHTLHSQLLQQLTSLRFGKRPIPVCLGHPECMLRHLGWVNEP